MEILKILISTIFILLSMVGMAFNWKLNFIFFYSLIGKGLTYSQVCVAYIPIYDGGLVPHTVRDWWEMGKGPKYLTVQNVW